MRKLLLGMLFFSLAGFTNDFVHGIPNGHYAGEGTWVDNLGGSGRYNTYVELQNNDMRVDYSFDDRSVTVFLSFWFNSAGAFDVVYRGGIIGNGTCETDRCSYEIYVNGLRQEESLTFGFDLLGEPTLSKRGQKQFGDRLVRFQDGLYHVNLGEPDPIVLPIPKN